MEYSDIWPKDAFIPAPKLTAALASQLTIPIKFEYANGLVGKVYAPAGVSTTVLNIYRGILNVLQITIKKNHNVYDLQEVLIAHVLQDSTYTKKDHPLTASDFFFHPNQPGCQGVCKTHYIINEDRKAERILLIKTRDMSQCQEKIFKDMGLAYANRCPECEAVSVGLSNVRL